MNYDEYTLIEPIELPPMVRIGYKWGQGALYEAYRHPDQPESCILINRSAEIHRGQCERAGRPRLDKFIGPPFAPRLDARA